MKRLLIPLALILAAAPALAIDLNPHTDTVPYMASDGVDFFAVWTEKSNLGNRVLATRVSRLHQVIDQSPLVVASGAVYAVKYGAFQYLVLWKESGGALRATRVSQTGIKMDDTPITLDANPFTSAPALTFDGQRFFVVWISGLDLVGAFVAPDGTVSARMTLAKAGPSGGNNP